MWGSMADLSRRIRQDGCGKPESGRNSISHMVTRGGGFQEMDHRELAGASCRVGLAGAGWRRDVSHRHPRGGGREGPLAGRHPHRSHRGARSSRICQWIPGAGPGMTIERCRPGAPGDVGREAGRRGVESTVRRGSGVPARCAPRLPRRRGRRSRRRRGRGARRGARRQRARPGAPGRPGGRAGSIPPCSA